LIRKEFEKLSESSAKNIKRPESSGKDIEYDLSY
jgi:hypothetical protein